MNGIFLDTVGMIAVWDDTDQWHTAARAAYRALLAQGRHLVATSFVLCDCGNRFHTPSSEATAVSLLTSVSGEG